MRTAGVTVVGVMVSLVLAACGGKIDGGTIPPRPEPTPYPQPQPTDPPQYPYDPSDPGIPPKPQDPSSPTTPCKPTAADPEACTDSGLVMSATCHDGDYTSFTAKDPRAPALVIFGKYQSASGAATGHPPGRTTVTITKTSPVVLVLSSYEATIWTIVAAPGSHIEKIILNGYDEQSVLGAGAIPVETGPSYYGTAYAWPSAPGGSDTQGVVSAVEMKTGLSLSAFAGCYEADAFTLTDR